MTARDGAAVSSTGNSNAQQAQGESNGNSSAVTHSSSGANQSSNPSTFNANPSPSLRAEAAAMAAEELSKGATDPYKPYDAYNKGAPHPACHEDRARTADAICKLQQKSDGEIGKCWYISAYAKLAKWASDGTFELTPSWS